MSGSRSVPISQHTLLMVGSTCLRRCGLALASVWRSLLQSSASRNKSVIVGWETTSLSVVWECLLYTWRRFRGLWSKHYAKLLYSQLPVLVVLLTFGGVKFIYLYYCTPPIFGFFFKHTFTWSIDIITSNIKSYGTNMKNYSFSSEVLSKH